MGGLSPEDHGRANRDVWMGTIPELREKYVGDLVAQQQLDIYGRNPEYSIHFRQFCEALQAGDKKGLKKESAWFRKHYPDIG